MKRFLTSNDWTQWNATHKGDHVETDSDIVNYRRSNKLYTPGMTADQKRDHDANPANWVKTKVRDISLGRALRPTRPKGGLSLWNQHRFTTDNGAMKVGDRLPDPKAKEKSVDRAEEDMAGEPEDKDQVAKSTLKGNAAMQRFTTEPSPVNNDWAEWNAQHRGQGGGANRATLGAAKASAIAGVVGTEKAHRNAVGEHRNAAAVHDKMYRTTKNPVHANIAASHRDQADTHAVAAQEAKHGGAMAALKGGLGGAAKGAVEGGLGGGLAGSFVGAPGPGAALGAGLGGIAGGIRGAYHGYTGNELDEVKRIVREYQQAS
jgi:hypothetical protein